MSGCLSTFLGRRRRGGNDTRQPNVSHQQPSALQVPPIKHETGCADHGFCASGLPSEMLPQYSANDPYLNDQWQEPSTLSDLMQQVAESISQNVDLLDGHLRQLSLKMHGNSEIAFEEHKTAKLLTSFMKAQPGWVVEQGVSKLPTAWRAEFSHLPKGVSKSKAPTVGFNSEMDALPGIGHACGHNLIAIGGIAAALSVAQALVKHNLPGRVILLGTPAEENGGGKVLMLQEGAYKDIDACLMIHPAPDNSTGPMLAVTTVRVEYTGRTAHAGAAPQEGVNAQDAAVLAYTNISALRQQIETTARTHGIIIGQDWAPNVIPGKSAIVWITRGVNVKVRDEVKAKVNRCFQAAALATGCDVRIIEQVPYADLRNSATLAADYRTFMSQKYEQKYSTDPWSASTDFGDVTYALPALHSAYRIPLDDPKTQGNHTIGFTQAAQTIEAHRLTLQAAVGIAVVGARIIVESDYRKRVRQQWEQWRRQVAT